MSISLFLRGFAIGLAIAAPVGPVGVLCIHRTLDHGRLSGFISGLGAATADAVYGSIAALGLTTISTYLTAAQGELKLLGGLFLCYLGIRTMLEQPRPLDVASLMGLKSSHVRFSARSIGMNFGSTFLLTMTNPMTILSFAAIFTGLSVAGQEAIGAWAIIAGVFLGSASWWLLLSLAAGLLRKHWLYLQTTRIIHLISGIVILSFGAASLFLAIQSRFS